MMLCSAFSEDSSDLFLKGYKEFQAGEKLEREAKPREALAKYRSAQQILQQISKLAPDWQPLVVEYRLRKTQESVTRLEGDLASMPQSTEPLEGNLPEPEKEKPLPPAFSAGPVVTVKPPPAPKRGVNEPVRSTSLDRSVARGGLSVAERELRDLRSQLAQTRAENESLNERLLKKSADLQSALLEVDKTKVSVVELKAQLAQTTSSLEDMKKDGVSLPVIREGIERNMPAFSSGSPICRPTMKFFRRRTNACLQSWRKLQNISRAAIEYGPVCSLNARNLMTPATRLWPK